MKGIRRLFRFPSRRRADVHDEIVEEFQFHLDMRTAELVRSGLAEDVARAQAFREFGDRAHGIHACARPQMRIERQRLLARFAGECRQDLWQACRLMARSPGFSLAAILTLAIAIGANTAIFSVANALLFKPLPVADPQGLVRVRPGESRLSWPNYEDIRERNGVFTDVAAHRRIVAGLASPEAPIRLIGEVTSPNYLSVLGVTPALGRIFTPADSRHDLVVIADQVWSGRFGSDPSILGRILTINGQAREVIGVMPRGFRGVAPAGLLHDFWIPVDASSPQWTASDRADRQFEVIARLQPGITHAQAAASMEVLARQLTASHPELGESFLRMEVFPVDGIHAFRGMSSVLFPVLSFLVLMTVVTGFVLLIGCANIAGLLLGRAAARRREIAVRLALGAGRGRLVRQLLTEGLLLALIGGAAGALVAMWLAESINLAAGRLPIPVEFDVRLDRRVLIYALGVSALTSLVFALTPARRAARVDLVSSLKEGAATSVARQPLRHLLVGGQIAVCTMLLVWSGLFLRSMDRIHDVDPGFDASGVLLATVMLDGSPEENRIRGEQMIELQQHVRERTGVVSAGASHVVPLSLSNTEFYIGVEGSQGGGRRVFANRVTPGWFETLRIPLLAGRDVAWADREGAAGVVVVNETLARRFFGGPALGKRLFVPGPGEPRPVEIVGIVADSKYRTLGEATAPTIYLPFREALFQHEMTLHVRTADVRDTTDAIAQHMQRLAPDVFVEIRPMTDVTVTALLPARIGAAVTGAFGAAATLLAALGVFGLVSYSVAQRTREVGVRKAMGARTPDIIRLIVAGQVSLTAAGLAVGLGAGVLGATALRGFMTGVSPVDPATLGGVAMLVLGTSLVASVLPAVRAALVSPLVALRDL